MTGTLHSIAHLTLTDKLTDESDFADTVSALIAGQHSFRVKIKGWGFFYHGHNITVYLNIENPEPVARLAGLLKSNAKSPHISLAKKITHETFHRLLPYLERLDYTAEWISTEINVLRKLMSEKHLGFKESFKILLSGPSENI